MKKIKYSILLSALLFLFVHPLFAGNMDLTAKEIAQRSLDLENGDSSISLRRLITFRYTIKDRKVVAAEKPRVKLTIGVSKDYGSDKKDTKSVSIVKEPAGERGIGMLQHDYDEPGRDSDQWMYFSALNKVKRIISGKEDEPKTGSWYGSEISYEDLEKRHIEDYTYKILGEEIYLSRKCWVIEQIPTKKRARKSNYSKSINWIDQEDFLIIKSMLYNRSGKKVKRLTFKNYEKVHGIWIGRKMIVNNLETKRMTLMTTEKIAFNMDIRDSFFTQRTLTDGSFREPILNDLKVYLQ